MIAEFLFTSAIIGTSYAAWSDLRTTEVSDLVSILMISVGLGSSFIYSLYTGEWSFVVNSLIVGLSFLGFGGLLYFTGMWGGADALILGSTGFLIHTLPQGFNPALSSVWPYEISFIMNLFTIGAIYSSFYSVYLAFNQGMIQDFVEELKSYKKRLIIATIAYLGATLGVIFLSNQFLGIPINLTNSLVNTLVFLGAFLGLLVLYIFFRTIEDNSMVKTIEVEDLKEGDVLAEEIELDNEVLKGKKIKGLSKKQVEEIKEKEDKVTIKTGVTFVVVFPIAILVTLLFGDILYNLLMLVY